MSKFVASITEVSDAVNITLEDFNKALINQGGLISAMAYFTDQALMEFADEKEIFIVDSNSTNANRIADALNKLYEERVEAEGPTYTFAGAKDKAAFGDEAISNNDTEAAALNNLTKRKGDKPMKSIKDLVAAGVSDKDALDIASKYMKEEEPVRRGSGTIKQEEEQTNTFTFGGNEKMNTQTEKKEQQESNPQRRGGSYSGAANNDYTPSFSFGGMTREEQQGVVDTTGRTGFDATDRESEFSDGFDGAWYCNPNRYAILKDFNFYFENRRAIPANPYGLTKINFLNPQDKKVVEYDNKYEIVVELCFGKGSNYRIKLTRVTAEMKAANEARGFRASKSDWSTGNIKWVEQGGQLTPRYAFSVRNDLSLNVVCDCKKVHTVHTAWATTCKCGKKYPAVKMAPTGEAARYTFADKQSDWTPVVLNNFSTKVHKDCLALALACAAYERNLPVYGLDAQE